jgi:hypothetical protein
MHYEVLKYGPDGRPMVVQGHAYPPGSTIESRQLGARRTLQLELQRKIRPAAGERAVALPDASGTRPSRSRAATAA